jgi:hypothetical protein
MSQVELAVKGEFEVPGLVFLLYISVIYLYRGASVFSESERCLDGLCFVYLDFPFP